MEACKAAKEWFKATPGYDGANAEAAQFLGGGQNYTNRTRLK
jgi:hypothetical protein